jgi:topoisomerase IA-like protein
MKKNIIQFSAFLLGCLVSFACSDNDYAEMDKGSDVLTLTLDQAVTELNEQNHASEALTLRWT